ncbi:MAG: DNA alkylation repair protein, partial [Prevotellaceae bacterium]|nr:DNA alkylation repair protein [Prevotellaceae bacterium]
MKEKIITEIRQALKDCADEKTRQTSSRFFKEGEEALVYGVKMNEVGKIGNGFYKQLKNTSKQDIFEICEELWKSKYLE